MIISNIYELNDAIERIKRNDPELTDIYLAYNAIDDISKTRVTSLFEAIKESKTITNIVIGENMIIEDILVAFVETLKVNKSITDIEASEYLLRADETTILADALKVNKTIINLHLCYNSIKDNGAIALAKALEINKTIACINLRGSEIGSNGATALAKALEINKTITNIRLGHNIISDSGAVALAESLKINKTITHIDLSRNQINSNGIIALAKALEINKTITHIDLSDTGNISDAGAIALAESLKINRNITSGYIYVGLRHINIFNDAIRRNREFLETAVQDLIAGKPLDKNQHETIRAHFLGNNIEETLGLLSESTQKEFLQYNKENKDLFAKVMEQYQNKTKDNAKNEISEFLSTGNMGNFNQAMVNKYFHGKLPIITPETTREFVDMMQASGNLRNAINLPNNAIFISDALNAGVQFSVINNNLNKIVSNLQTNEFALKNPKKLGYLMTLSPKKLDRALEILSHPKIKEFVKKEPQEIAFLTRISDDPIKLNRAIVVIEKFPNLKSVKSLVESTDHTFNIAIQAPGLNRKRARDKESTEEIGNVAKKISPNILSNKRDRDENKSEKPPKKSRSR